MSGNGDIDSILVDRIKVSVWFSIETLKLNRSSNVKLLSNQKYK